MWTFLCDEGVHLNPPEGRTCHTQNLIAQHQTHSQASLCVGGFPHRGRLEGGRSNAENASYLSSPLPDYFLCNIVCCLCL
jgi:hypothetical protein